MFSFVSMIMYRYNNIHHPNRQGPSVPRRFWSSLQNNVIIWARISSLDAFYVTRRSAKRPIYFRYRRNVVPMSVSKRETIHNVC